MKNSPVKKPSRLVREGQVWQLGRHRLLVGDALDFELVQKLIGGDKVHCVLTDVPYGISYTESKENFASVKVNKKIINDNISDEGKYKEFMSGWIKNILPYMSKKNSIYIFNCDKMLFALKASLDECKIYFSQLLIWVKNQAVIGRKDYLPQHELIVFGWYGTHMFRRSKDKSVLFYPRPTKSSLHPTMKPIPLLRNLILNSTRINDIVYDCFLGSGSTLIACEQTHRICLGIELDVEYCQTVMNRFEKLTKIQPKLIYEQKH
jgi:DNA modification methylase